MKISAIVPYFEAHRTIENSLRSLVDGDLPPDEIIVVNDGSSEQSREQLNEIVHKLGSTSINIIDHKYNLGIGFARNTAILHSQNDWIFNLDADNLAPRKLLKSLAEFIEKSSGDAQVVSPQRVVFFDDTTRAISHTWMFRDSELTPEQSISRTVLPRSSGNYMFSKDSWYKSGGYPIAARALENWGFGLRLQLAGYAPRVVPGTLYFHRIGLPSYYVQESKDMERLSLIATAQILEEASRLPSKLVRSLLNVRKARTWLARVKAPAAYSDPRLGFDEGYTTPRDAIHPVDIQELDRMLAMLEPRSERF